MSLKIGDTIPANFDNEKKFKEFVEPALTELMFLCDQNDCAASVSVTYRRKMRDGGDSIHESSGSASRGVNSQMHALPIQVFTNALRIFMDHEDQLKGTSPLEKMNYALRASYEAFNTSSQEILEGNAKFR